MFLMKYGLAPDDGEAPKERDDGAGSLRDAKVLCCALSSNQA